MKRENLTELTREELESKYYDLQTKKVLTTCGLCVVSILCVMQFLAHCIDKENDCVISNDTVHLYKDGVYIKDMLLGDYMNEDLDDECMINKILY